MVEHYSPQILASEEKATTTTVPLLGAIARFVVVCVIVFVDLLLFCVT